MEQASESQRDNSQVRPTSLSDQGSTELITLPEPVAEQIENVNGNVNENGQTFVNTSQSRQFDSDNTVKTALEKSERIGFLTLSGPGGGGGSEARMTKLTADNQKPLIL